MIFRNNNCWTLQQIVCTHYHHHFHCMVHCIHCCSQLCNTFLGMSKGQLHLDRLAWPVSWTDERCLLTQLQLLQMHIEPHNRSVLFSLNRPAVHRCNLQQAWLKFIGLLSIIYKMEARLGSHLGPPDSSITQTPVCQTAFHASCKFCCQFTGIATCIHCCSFHLLVSGVASVAD